MATQVSAKDVSSLRAKTGAGMMDCKKALMETQGDVEKAVDFLRTKGIAKAEKRAGKAASQGLVFAYQHFHPSKLQLALKMLKLPFVRLLLQIN